MSRNQHPEAPARHQRAPERLELAEPLSTRVQVGGVSHQRLCQEQDQAESLVVLTHVSVDMVGRKRDFTFFVPFRTIFLT